MTIPERLNKLIKPIIIKRTGKKYYSKMVPLMKSRPDLFKDVSEEVKRNHRQLWGKLGLPVNDAWLRFYSNISRIEDYRYLPEDIFLLKVERILNDWNRAGGEAEDKNQYSLYIDPRFQPKFVVRFLRGLFFDNDYNYLSDSCVDKILSEDQGPLIGKIAVGSGGGHGIKYLTFKDGAYFDKGGVKIDSRWIRLNFESYAIQEKVEQCDFSAQFNPSSANTCRIITFRQPWDGDTYVVKAGMRFGVTTEVYDNLSSGGVCVNIFPNGQLSDLACNWYKMQMYNEHPTSKISFAGKVHPYFKAMNEVACRFAKKMPNFNLISWDMVADKNGDIKILEVNETSQGSDWLQYFSGPFFGDATELVVDWCVEHQHYDNFRFFRS